MAYQPEFYYRYHNMTAAIYTEMMHSLTTDKRMKKLAKAGSSELVKLINGYIGAACVQYHLKLYEEDKEHIFKDVLTSFYNWKERQKS